MNKKYALITGSSSGIGLDIAQELASRGYNIVLTARREERLKNITAQLIADFGVDADYVVADLGESNAPGTIFNFCSSNNYEVDILVNNAGYTINKQFHEISEEEEERFLRVLGLAAIALTKRFIPGMLEQKSGKIMLVSSLAAFAPPARGALYGPVKTYVNRFGEALNLNYRSQGITATNVCPGFVKTEFHSANGMQDVMDKLPSFMKKDSKAVAKGAVDAMISGKYLWIPGLLVKMIAFFCYHLPASLVIKVGSGLAGGRYD
jgi:uncharacterized protein